MAPEVIKDKGYSGATADLWSCGVILYVLLAGYLPFEEDNMNVLYKKVRILFFVAESGSTIRFRFPNLSASEGQF